jgi:protein-tyrosine phosphatase
MLANLDKVVARFAGRLHNPFPAPRRACVTVVGTMQRAELHFHLLPGVDDGPEDMDEAVALARLAVADGTALVTVTPHVRDLLGRGILGELRERVDAVAAALRAAAVPLALLPGAELAHDDLPLLGDRDLDAIAQGPPGARWVLIEAPLFGRDADGFLAATAELRARGFGTLIGHPERCAALMQRPGAVAAERRAGALLQVNGSSLTGRHGERARAWGIELLLAGDAAVIGSDAHRPARPPVLGAALDAVVAAGMDRRGAEALVAAGPCALLRDGIAVPDAVRAA